MASSRQVPFTTTRDSRDNNPGWNLTISSQWDVLGPFPIHAREQHFLSPSFPLNLSETIDFHKIWPSSYADGGYVGWNVTKLDGEELKISFPHIRWKALRATEGWAALQHHAVLRAILTVHPSQFRDGTNSPPQLRVNIKQGSYFTILPYDNVNASVVPEWHAGNIYDMERALPHTVELPHPPSTDSPTNYQLFISGDYEIRLFGDPHVRGSEVPVQTIGVQIQLQEKQNTVVHELAHDVIPDFMEGFAFGETLGVGLRSISGWWTIDEVHLESPRSEGFEVQLKRKMQLAPSQLRVLPLSITQDSPIEATDIKVSIKLTSRSHSMMIPVSFTLNHRSWNSPADTAAVKASFFYASSMPSLFLTIPPTVTNDSKVYPVILALHGAGVDIVDHAFWSQSLPMTEHNWIVIPTGRTSWGLDWHGPSAIDAWGSVAALSDILLKSTTWNGAQVSQDSQVIIMGHSNGGQGAWYLASRFPDRVLGVIPAAGYIKSQAYVPLTQSRSAHFIDPGLRAVLESSLTPDDNDIHLSNLANIPIMAIHGGDDENVPVWHSREAIGIVNQWSTESSKNTICIYHEDPGQGHWYPTVLANEQVLKFIDTLNSPTHRNRSGSFTVTASDPHASGPSNGWKIECLTIPGRIGRLNIVHTRGNPLIVRTSNIDRFSVDFSYFLSGEDIDMIQIDNSTIRLQGSFVVFESFAARSWRLSTSTTPQSPSRIQAILSSPGPLLLIIPDFGSIRELSVAIRVAHDLHLYHRLDAEIIDQQGAIELFSQSQWSGGNAVFVGRSSSGFVSHILRSKMIPVELTDGQLYMNGMHIDEQAILFLHPNPLGQQSTILFCLYKSDADLERAARLFPIRTGVTIPSWVMIDRTTDKIGAGGVRGAGIWGPSWNWNEQMSWYY